MSAINVNSITGRTGTHGPVLTGVTTATNGLNVTGGFVGIGTDNPAKSLSILSSQSVMLQLEGTSSTARIGFKVPNTSNSPTIGVSDEEDIQFRTGGTERLRITSGGEVQITNSGSSNGSTVQQLSLYTDNSGNGDNFTQRIAYTRANDTSKVFTAIDSVRTGTFNTDLVFSNDDAGVLGEKLRLISTGNVSIANGDLVVASGHGIDFSGSGNAAGMTSELLDDYEEGTWTPTYYGASTAGSYTLQSTSSEYTKIGDIVHLIIDIKNIVEVSAGTGLLRIGGLPFQPTNGNEAGSIILEGFTFPSTVEYVVTRTSAVNHIAIVGVRNSGVDVQFNVGDRDSSTSDIFGQITYKTSA